VASNDLLIDHARRLEVGFKFSVQKAMHGRSLYIYDADQAPWTYATNYVITAICLGGVASYLLMRPKVQPAPPQAAAFATFPPATLLMTHLTLYGIVMLIGGLGHQVWYHDQCPGRIMPQNITVSCPDGLDNEPVVRSYLTLLGPAEMQLVPLGIALSGLARSSGKLGAYQSQAVVSQVLGLLLGILGAALGHDGFLVLGVILALCFLVLPILTAIGICREPGSLVKGKVLVIIGSVIGVIGMGIQQIFTGVCGSSAYQKDGASSCPFGGDGVTGINHNAVFHIVDAVSKIILVAALFCLRIASPDTVAQDV